MPERDHPMTQTIAASEARQQWSQLLNRVFRKETRVIVEKSGVPVAALVSAEDLARLTLLEEERGERFRALDESWKAFEGVPLAEVEQEVAQAVEQARQKQRRKPAHPTRRA
jgi:prevent-host-death family protein